MNDGRKVFGEYISKLVFRAYPGDINLLAKKGLVGDVEFAIGVLGAFVGDIIAAYLDSRLVVTEKLGADGLACKIR